MENSVPDRNVAGEFQVRRTRQLIATVPAVLAVLPLGLMDKGQESFAGIPASVLLPVCLVVLFACIAFSLWNWRCPSCRRYLGKQFNPAFCSGCGVRFQ